MKIKLTFLALILSVLSYCQDLEGKWVNRGFTGESNMTYEFQKENVLKIYYAGKELPTADPVEYTLKDLGNDRYRIEMQYINLSNNYSANVVGLIAMLGKDRAEIEIWDRNSVPEKLEFSEESLIFERDVSQD